MRRGSVLSLLIAVAMVAAAVVFSTVQRSQHAPASTASRSAPADSMAVGGVAADEATAAPTAPDDAHSTPTPESGDPAPPTAAAASKGTTAKPAVARPGTAPAARAATSSGAPPQAPSSPPASVVSTGCQGSFDRLVPVSNTAQLQVALAGARPGDRIAMADGTYLGQFKITASGRADRRITLCGTRAAILDGATTLTGYVLGHVGSYWDLRGFTVTNGQKGIVLDRASYNVLDSLEVHTIGDEGVHFRSASTNNLISNSVIRDTGRRNRSFGEGIYVGSATNNWCLHSGCGPDRSDNNRIEGNTISGTTAEAVDIKEGTTGGSVVGNWFDGSGSDSLSWVDVKGKGWRISANHGRQARRDGFLVSLAAEGWGTGNSFSQNVAEVNGSGYGFRLLPGNALACDNVVSGARLGVANVACTTPA